MGFGDLLTQQLKVLAEAAGDPAQLALATVDLAHPSLSETERNRLKAGLEAAAVPHWVDEPLLGALPVVRVAGAGGLRERLDVEVLARPLTICEVLLGLSAGAGRAHRPIVLGPELVLQCHPASRLHVAPREEREHHEGRDDGDDDPPRRIHVRFLLVVPRRSYPAAGRGKRRGATLKPRPREVTRGFPSRRWPASAGTG